MKTVLRWAIVYLFLLIGLTALGLYNHQLSSRLQALQTSEADLSRKETRLLLEQYRLVSPLALRQWAEANGYVPMSLAQWDNPRSGSVRPAPEGSAP